MFNDIIKVYICMHLYEIECILQARLSMLLVLLVSSVHSLVECSYISEI